MSEADKRPSTDNDIPSRFGEKAVARYAEMIQKMCDSWPEPIVVDTGLFSKETYRCRFRDAVRGVMFYGVGSSELYDTLKDKYEDIRIEEWGANLLIGAGKVLKSRSKAAPQRGAMLSGIATLTDGASLAVGPSSELIRAILLLKDYGIIESVTVTGVTEEFIWTCIPHDSEVQILENADGSLLIY